MTAGIERRIVLHSPTSSSPCTQNLSLSPANVRQLTEENSEQDRRVYISALLDDETSEIDYNEMRTISLFDQSVDFISCFLYFPTCITLLRYSILRQEGQADVFESRFTLVSDGSDSEEDNVDQDINASSSSDMGRESSDDDSDL